MPRNVFRSKKDMDTFKKQVAANENFFVNNRPDLNVEEIEKPLWVPAEWEGEMYDITGFNARLVVALLSDIVNRGEPKWACGKFFYFLIKGDAEAEYKQVFSLEAQPTESKPGNGVVRLMCPKGEVRTRPRQPATRYSRLKTSLNKQYEGTTARFARHLKELFRDNSNIRDAPDITAVAYAILLFEIARRLVRREGKTPSELDRLPIGSAIARAVNLLSCGACTFDDFFSKDLYCFTGTASKRTKAIDKINIRYCETFQPEVSVSEESCLAEEVRKLFDENQEQAVTYVKMSPLKEQSGQDETTKGLPEAMPGEVAAGAGNVQKVGYKDTRLYHKIIYLK